MGLYSNYDSISNYKICKDGIDIYESEKEDVFVEKCKELGVLYDTSYSCYGYMEVGCTLSGEMTNTFMWYPLSVFSLLRIIRGRDE
jgi:hypothetical protein